MGINIQIPLIKIDEERRLVVGRAVQEVRDRSGEILDYASAVGAFREWSNSFSVATQGLSKGNVRVMHNPKVVAGKVVDIQYNDADKAIDIVAKIVDDQEWKKVVEGVYTGFSVGGSYARKWQDGDVTRYTPKVAEISLVDRPCIPTCTIAELHKADGSVEELYLHGRPADPMTYGALAKRAPKTYGDLGKLFGFGRRRSENLLSDGEHGMWDDDDHPRDARGRFAKKSAAVREKYGKLADDASPEEMGATVLAMAINEDMDKLQAKVALIKERRQLDEDDDDLDMNLLYGNGSIGASLIEEVREGKEDPVKALQIWHDWVRGSRMAVKRGKLQGIINVSPPGLDGLEDGPVDKADRILGLEKRNPPVVIGAAARAASGLQKSMKAALFGVGVAAAATGGATYGALRNRKRAGAQKKIR